MKDKNKQKKSKPGILSAVIVFAFSFLIGALLGRYVGALIPIHLTWEEGLLHIVMLFVGLYVGLLLQIVVHEGGHLICGICSGYRFLSFRIGSLMLARTEKGMTLKRFSIPGTAGQCLLAPPDLNGGSFPVVFYNLGGVLFNTILSLCLFGLSFLTPSYLSIALVVAAAMGVVLALTNGIPIKNATLTNDGFNAILLAKNQDARIAFWYQLQINARITGGERLQDLPAEWFVRPDDKQLGNAMGAALFVFRCNWLLDGGNIEAAEREIETLLDAKSEMAGIHRTLLTLDLIFCKLISGKTDAPILSKWEDATVKSVRKSLAKNISLLRTEYAYQLLFKKDQQVADNCRTRFEKALKKYPFSGDALCEKELIALVDLAAEKAAISANSPV